MDASILVSDPWELGTECGVGPFIGKVLMERNGAVLIRLSQPIRFKDRHLSGVVATPRYGQEKIRANDPIPMNMLLTTLPEEVTIDFLRTATGVSAVGTVRFTNTND